jgi:hypothetical protein
MKEIGLGQTIGILAKVGVIVGIVFLAVEIRDGRGATQAASLQTASALDQEIPLKCRGRFGHLATVDHLSSIA